MTEESKVSLSQEDWDSLVPIKEVSIASKKIVVKPLGFKKLRETIVKLGTIEKELTEKGVTLENYESAQSLLAIASIVLERMPEIISDSSNLHPDDIEGLPINVAIILVEAILDANIESQKGLVKNLAALASKAGQIVRGAVSEEI